MKHIHILGICGTFMGSLAIIARELGYKVTGSDTSVYPPMSTYLESQGIEIIQGYEAEQLNPAPDMIVVGNTMKRGMPVIEYMLNKNLTYRSGPQWLYEHCLNKKWVLAVAGTHGKTTTTSMLAFILDQNGLNPGFLIGGIPVNFQVSSRLGGTDFFVIEADEYDCAFFDKRSKFVHYHPRTAILNNLEYDHADIFENVAAIQKQFHHLVRTIPSEGLIVENADEPLLKQAVDMGCWTPRQTFGNSAEWQAKLLEEDGSSFIVMHNGKELGTVNWQILGRHNVNNALAAIAAAQHVGIMPQNAIEALASFKGVKRRLELRGEANQIKVFDDFAHHPTAIETTLQGVKAHNKKGRVIAVIEPRSNSMRMGQFREALRDSLQIADHVFVFEPANLGWNMKEALANSKVSIEIYPSTQEIIDAIKAFAKPQDKVVIMSNGGFENIHERLLVALK
ncbi:MAG: UDP-N-acetylmuramate:L-alanyl-gamma-D-glutamyl-meso-diaminopimelate ligase [Gammaproteobacteria bacterium]|jgi:UDP-N-acetylmuramate: L-alanyl-gamma-D-glutamyl-meso-diaminopimelate ligase|nr:UDP-N-acetylmuramate:L-alanyl-gamma-D-glutamyl-meso-diaminopimelate ligase [Gammaproteobacteria bacterium]